MDAPQRWSDSLADLNDLAAWLAWPEVVALGVALIGVGLAAYWLGARAAHPRAADAAALAAVMETTVQRRDALQTVADLLQTTVRVTDARAGLAYLADAHGWLRLVRATGLPDLTGLERLSPSDAALAARLASDEAGLVSGGDAETGLAALAGVPAAVSFGARTSLVRALAPDGAAPSGEPGLLVLVFASRRAAEDALPLLGRVGRYADQVLAEYRSLQSQVRDVQRLGRELQEREANTDTVVHDALNRLQSIGAMLLGAQTEPGLEARKAEKARAQVEMLMDMLQDLSQPERDLEPEPVAVEQLVELAAALASGYRAQGIGFETTVRAGLPDVLAERAQIVRVLDNLLVNAVRHNVDEVERLAVQLRVDARVGDVLFAVADNGQGIPAAQQALIFDKGYRGAAEPAARGRGIGLYSCRRIIERHGGRIWVESQPGQGATFLFTLPAARRVVKRSAPVPESLRSYLGESLREAPVRDEET